MTHKEYNLNLLNLTGKLSETTPKCVVSEILRSHCISLAIEINSIADLINSIAKINNCRTKLIREDSVIPMTDRDFQALATFINYNCKVWSKSSLKKAYEHIFSIKDSSFGENHTDLLKIVYGEKTPQNLTVFTASMLYFLCKKFSIKTTWQTTPEEMLISIRRIGESPSLLRNQIFAYLQNASKYELVNLLGQLNISTPNNELLNIESKTPDKLPVYELNDLDLKNSLNNFRNSNYVLMQVKPKSHSDAVILTALLYNINITESKYPLEEYEIIQKSKHISLYLPKDKKFRKNLITNSRWYDLTVHWEPKLNMIYDTEGLKKLCIYEGYQGEDFMGYSFESLLQLSRISFNVFYGKYNGEQELTPILLEELSSLENSECFTFGNVETKELTTFSIKELVGYFRSERAFKNPLKPSEFLEDRIINKIKLFITQNHSSPKSRELSIVIQEVEKWKEYTNEFTITLRDTFRNDEMISKTLYKIMEVAMLMRGWKVASQEFPLFEDDTKHKEDLYKKIESNVGVEITSLFESIEKLNESSRKILKDLPLLKMTYQEKTLERRFIATPDPDDGSSIYERLTFVVNGDSHKNMKSCIRLSSNIILTSIYFYIVSLGLPEPFNINQLEYIS